MERQKEIRNQKEVEMNTLDSSVKEELVKLLKQKGEELSS